MRVRGLGQGVASGASLDFFLGVRDMMFLGVCFNCELFIAEREIFIAEDLAQNWFGVAKNMDIFSFLL